MKHGNQEIEAQTQTYSPGRKRLSSLFVFLFLLAISLHAQVTDTRIFKQRAGEEFQDEDAEADEKEDVPTPPVGKMTLAADFVKEGDALAPGSMFFNVLKIDNPSDEVQHFQVNFDIPPRCKLILQPGDDQELNLAPGKTKYMPVRLAFPTDVVGGVPYELKAAIIHPTGKSSLSPPIEKEIFFEQVCKWRFSTPESKVFLARSEQKFQEIAFKLKNYGNCAEEIDLKLQLGSYLESPQARMGNIQLKIPVRPSTDTLVLVDVRVKKGAPEGGEGLKLSAEASSPFDTLAQTLAVFFEVVDDAFINELQEDESPLILAFDQAGIGTDAISSFRLGGRILLTGDRDISYRYETTANLLSPSLSDAREVFWEKARMIAAYNTPAYRFSVGDVSGGSGISVSGRGIKISKGFGKKDEVMQNRVGFTLVKGLASPTWGMAASVSSKFSDRFSAFGSFTYNNDKVKHLSTTAPSAGFNLAVGEYGRLSASGLFTSQSEMGRASANKNGFGYQVEYGLSKDRLTFKAKNSYGSQHLANGDRGTLKLRAKAAYDFGRKGRLGVSYHNLRTLIEDEDAEGQLHSIGSQSNEVIKAAYNLRLGRVALGAGIENRMNKKKYSLLGGGTFFQGSRTYRLGASTKWKHNNSPEKFLAPSVVAGMTELTRYNTPGEVYNPKYAFARAGLKGQYKGLAFHAVYNYGPRQGLNDVFFTETEGSIYQQDINISASHKYLSADESFSLYSDAQFEYNLNEQIARLQASTQAEYAFNNGWSIHLGSGLNLKDVFEKQKSSQERLSIADLISVNAGAKKVFDFDQPRLKYYNLRLHFFKDANGNKTWEAGEEGIKSVLVQVERTKEPVMTNKGPLQVKFKPPNVMSDEMGFVEIAKAPQGSYLVHLEELFMMTDYANLNSFHLEVFLNRHKTILVPYSKSVTLSGKVKITRDKFSRLHGITPANIRVTVIDQNGDQHYALTSGDGSYIITVPYSETYRISMKNVLGKQFDLIGAEQELETERDKSRYEVGFHFKEKGRGINFN